MIEEPSFDYKYDLAIWKSFSARLSLTILIVAACVFMVSAITYLYINEEPVKQNVLAKERTKLHEAVLNLRLQNAQSMLKGDTLTDLQCVSLLKDVKSYERSFVLVTSAEKQLIYVGDSTFIQRPNKELAPIVAAISSGETGMYEIHDGPSYSYLLYEPVGINQLCVAVVCSRFDIFLGFKSLIFYGAITFTLGLILLFVFCSMAIHRMVSPLKRFADAAMSIADGNLETPLPQIKSKDELLTLRDSFGYMQTSLKRYINDLRNTTMMKERMESELTIAHDIQMGMIPTSFPKMEGLDIYASMNPAKEVGGDLFDFLLDGDELFFIIGDVAGKGVPASLYMAVTRTLFRNLAGNYQSAANVVREINHAITTTNESCLFVTLFVGVLDIKNAILTYCNASHNPPILVQADGTCALLNVEPNVPVGIVDHYNYHEQQIDFTPGMSLLLYTDGLTESVNQEKNLYGEERMLNMVQRSCFLPAQDFVKMMWNDVKKFASGAEQHDDLTMLYVKNLGQNSDVLAEHWLILKNELTESARLVNFIVSVCGEHGIEENATKSICLAVEEAVVNVIRYAYPHGTRGRVAVRTEYKEGVFAVEVKDSGMAFDPTKAGKADTSSDVSNRPIGGLGIHLMGMLMDRVSYERTEDGYNVLRLEKNINQPTK